MAREPKPFQIVIHEGRELRDYGDGSLRDEKGIVRHVNSAVARERGMQRYYKGKEAVAQALQDYYNTESPEEGLYKLALKKIAIADQDNTRVGNEAFRMVLKSSGYIDDGTMQRREEHRIPEVRFELPKEFQDALKEVLTRYERDVIDGEFVDEETNEE